MTLELAAGAALTGLLGGFGHCLSMCGPLVASVSLALRQDDSRLGRLGVHARYNAGRVTTYAAVGALMGLVGSFVDVAGRLAGVQHVVSVLAGALMIGMGLGAAGVTTLLRGVERRAAALVVPRLRGLLDVRARGRAYGVGLGLGLLPCGLSYSAFLAAAGSGDALSGLVLALSFGLGTSVALLAAGLLTGALSPRLRGAAYRAAGLGVAAAGAVFVWRGLTS